MYRSILFLLVLCATSCLPPTQEIDLEFPYEKGMAVYGFWSLDRPYELFVGNSIRVAEAGELNYLPDAEVLLLTATEQVDILRFEQGRYVSTTNYELLPEVEYEVVINHSDFPTARATITLPQPDDDLPAQLVNVVDQNEETITFTAQQWLIESDYELGHYPFSNDDENILIEEPLDSLFLGFNLGNPFQLGGDISTEFTIPKTFEMVPPFVPEFMLVELSALEFVAYRLNAATLAYREYDIAIRGPLSGSSEISLVDLEKPGNVEGGYGLLTYYEEIRQRVEL